MSERSELERLLAPMTEREVDLDGPEFRIDRERVLGRMAGAMRAPAPDKRWPFGYAALAAAGALLLFAGVRSFSHDAASRVAPRASLEVLVSEGRVSQLHGAERAAVPQQGSRISADGELETGAGSKAAVRTADGLQLELSAQTRVALADMQPANTQLKLIDGMVRCTVPHRSAGHAFRVVTDDATVVDLGTVFTVSIEGPNHATHVVVEEGEVMVRRGSSEVRVQAGGRWASDAAEPSPPIALPPAPSAAAIEPEVSANPLPGRLAPGRPAPATLGQEAQLLRQGLAAERQGRSTAAISALTQLIRKYPHSPLLPDARAALARVEARRQQ